MKKKEVNQHMLKNSDYILTLLNGNLKFCKKAQVGVDLSVDKIYMFEGAGSICKNSTCLPGYIELPTCKDLYVLSKGTYIVELNESIRLDKNDTGIIIGRSSMNRCGVSVISAVWDPGYTSNNLPMSIRISVDNEAGVVIEKNARIAQLIIMQNEDCEQYNGQYQGGKGTPCTTGTEF